MIDMNLKQHFIVYFLFWLIMSIAIIASIYMNFSFISIYFCVVTILTFVLSNPDLDQLVDIGDPISFLKETKEMDNHRSFFTHSILMPITWYYLIRYYLDIENEAKMSEFGLALFLPVFIHLLADYNITHLIGINGTKGTWLISLNPLDKFCERIVNGYIMFYNLIKKPKKLRKKVNYKARLNKTWSFIWILGNIVAIGIYVYVKFLI